MYLSSRMAFVRNIAVAAINGTVTLIILLIAPLGLAAVISNTLLVAASTFTVCFLSDLVVAWLSYSHPPDRLLGRGQITHRQGKAIREIERRWWN